MNRKRVLSLSFFIVYVCVRERSHHIHTKSYTCTHNSSLKFITTFQITAFITKPTIQLLTVSNMRNALAAAYVVLSANKSSAFRNVRFSQYNLFSFFLSYASRTCVCGQFNNYLVLHHLFTLESSNWNMNLIFYIVHRMVVFILLAELL